MDICKITSFSSGYFILVPFYHAFKKKKNQITSLKYYADKRIIQLGVNFRGGLKLILVMFWGVFVPLGSRQSTSVFWVELCSPF